MTSADILIRVSGVVENCTIKEMSPPETRRFFLPPLFVAIGTSIVDFFTSRSLATVVGLANQPIEPERDEILLSDLSETFQVGPAV